MMRASNLVGVAMIVAAHCALAGYGMAGIRSAPRGSTSTALSASVVFEPRSVWLVFIDDLHFNFIDTKQLRTVLKAISSELIRNGDAFVVRASGSFSRSFELTSDRERLDQAIRSAVGNGLKSDSILLSLQGDLGLNEVRYRAARTRSAACEMIGQAQDLDELRKAFIYIGNGFTFDLPSSGRTTSRPESPFACIDDKSGQTSLDQSSKLTDMALRAGITIFAIDPRDLPSTPRPDPNADNVAWQTYQAATREGLRAMAEGTGGLTLAPGEELLDFLKTISREMGR